MTNNIIIIILIILIVFFYIIKLFFSNNNTNINPISKCWINNKKYPEAEKIYNSRNIIINELKKILDTDKWAIWSNDYNTTPIFSEMTDDEILTRINSNLGKINSEIKPSWRLFGLILNKKILPNSKLCPQTMDILKLYSKRILNAGFSLLEPRCIIGLHFDTNDKFYRLHIPLIIPNANNNIKNSFVDYNQAKQLCILQVENEYKIWKNDEYFIFDDTCYHNAWNYTNELRIILIIDLLKN